MLWKSPTQDVIHIGLTDGTAIAIGPEPREIPPKFESHALSAGAVVADNGKRRGRPPREQQQVTADQSQERVAATDPLPDDADTAPIETAIEDGDDSG